MLVILAATLLFLFLVRAIEKHPPTEAETSALKPYLVPALFWTASLILTLLIVYGLGNSARTPAQDRWLTAGWLASLLSLLIGVCWSVRWRPPRLQEMLTWLRVNAIEIVLLLALLGAGLAERTFSLDQHPYPWSGDEASVGMEGRRILLGQTTNLFSTGWSGQPNLSFVPTAVCLAIWGDIIFAVRMMSAITGTLTILTLFLLAREIFGRETALIAAGFLVGFPFHLHFSRIGVDNIADGLMVTLALWLVFRAVRTNSFPTYLLAGIASGLTFYTYVGTRLVFGIAAAAILYFCIQKKEYLRLHIVHLLAFLSSLLVTAAPIGYFFLKNPHIFMTRIGQESIFLNGWLQNQVELTGQSAVRILLNQVSKTVLVYISQNAGGFFFNSPEPYLTVLASILFLIGMGIAFWRFFEPRNFVLLPWFWSVVLLGGILTLSPPAHTRLVMTAPAVALFVAIGLWKISTLLVQFKFNSRWVSALTALLVGFLLFQSTAFYFGKYWAGNYFQDINGELAMEVGLELKQLGPEYNLYLFGQPRIFTGFPTTEFLVPETRKFDLTADSIPTLIIPAGQGALFAATPDNRTLLEQAAALFPGGVWEEIPRKTKPEVLYYAYLLQPSPADRP
ncbi:MAG: glycosyltransferase family 39 protein [Syntrophaceae bacterium]|nr:glycosyltransferase family 39 protein [Syntrophaceae bacterium]